MVLDNIHRDIITDIHRKTGIPIEIITDVIIDYIGTCKSTLKEAINNSDLELDFRIMIPNLGSFYNIKGRRVLKRLKKESNESCSV